MDFLPVGLGNKPNELLAVLSLGGFYYQCVHRGDCLGVSRAVGEGLLMPVVGVDEIVGFW